MQCLHDIKSEFFSIFCLTEYISECFKPVKKKRENWFYGKNALIL